MLWESQVVHLGECTDPKTGATSTPIYQTSAFRNLDTGQRMSLNCFRTLNQTRQAVEQAIAQMESGAAGFTFASGLAAITTVLMLLRSGDHVVISECFGSLYRLIGKVLKEFGLEATFVDPSIENIAKAIRPMTRALLVETPTNPLMKIIDLRKLVGLARMNNLLSIVDNTFLTPYLQRPLEFGIDLVLHSGTRFLSGNNADNCGLVVARNHGMAKRISLLRNTAGNVLDPQESGFLLNGIRTLALRMDKHGSNAKEVAEFLLGHPKVAKVYYPGLQTHPGHDTQEGQASGHGGIVSFSVKNPAIVNQVLERLEMFRFAERVGGVKSLITFPSAKTHADIPADIRERLGINDCLLQLSVGIEHLDDIIEDLAQALE